MKNKALDNNVLLLPAAYRSMVDDERICNAKRAGAGNAACFAAEDCSPLVAKLWCRNELHRGYPEPVSDRLP